MATELCFFGPPHSGKTTLALKTALYLAKNRNVILLFCDRVTPHLPWLFPRYRAEEIRSVGTALSAVDMTEEKLMESATVGKSGNLLFFGYGSGENRYSYPEFGAGRANALFNSLDTLAETVVVDCTSDVTSDVLTEAALKRADGVFRIYTPDMSSFAFYDAQSPILHASDYREERHVKVLNCTEREIPLPESEARAALHRDAIRVPFGKNFRRQRAEGTLAEEVPDKKTAAALQKLLDAVPPKES